MIDAIIDIAARGRQVFYFTAQSADIARWEAAIGDRGGSVEFRSIDMAGLRTANTLPLH